jgi:hypothetical protein
MTLVTEIAATSVLLFAAILFIFQLAAREVGYAIGRRHVASHPGSAETVGIVVGAMLALLAFILALTLSFANTRFSERRADTLSESNAIGTAWPRAEAIGHPRGVVIARVIEDYARTRADFVRAGKDTAALDAITQRTQALQTQIWGNLTAIVREKPDVISAALQASLNDMFDAGSAARFAYSLRLPAGLFWLLIGMAMLGMAALGFQFGLRGNPTRIMSMLLALLWTVVIVDILDLAAARLGTIRTGAAVYDWTIQGFGQDIPIPPPPAGR